MKKSWSKNSIKIWGGLLGTVILSSAGILSLNTNQICKMAQETVETEQIPKTIKEEIEIARKIWEIERLYEKSDKESISKIKAFLKDEEMVVKRIAAQKTAYLGYESVFRDIKDIPEEKFIKNSYSIAKVLNKAKNKPKKEVVVLMINLAKDHPELLGEIVTFFCEKGWIKELQQESQNIPKLHWAVKNSMEVRYTQIKQYFDTLPKDEKQKRAIYLLTNWKSSDEITAAIFILIEIGKETIPEILELLKESTNLPSTSPPPFERTHTNFSIILETLKSIPDDRSINELENLSNSKNKFISEEAKETLEWIKSGVPYPFKYERILFLSQDEGD